MAATNPRVESRYYERTDGGYVCGLCPHRCMIRYGEHGRCGSRRADEDMLVAYSYGKVSSLCVDPIEKKPLYHYKPKSDCFSVGGVGCNMSCRHCQNYAISRTAVGNKRSTYKSPEEIASMCRREGLGTVAFTYNEPMIWFEYICDFKAAAPEIDIVLVSNGLVNEEPLAELCRVADAMNIDIKGFTDEFYTEVCGAHLDDVLRSAKQVFDSGVHLALTYLVIPGYNDSDDEVRRFSQWVLDELSPDVPVHFSRFHPDNEMTDVPWTPAETVMRCREASMGMGLNFVYVGNLITDDAEDTVCPGCGRTVIKRLGYTVDVRAVYDGRCAFCGHGLNIRR